MIGEDQIQNKKNARLKKLKENEAFLKQKQKLSLENKANLNEIERKKQETLKLAEEITILNVNIITTYNNYNYIITNK